MTDPMHQLLDKMQTLMGKHRDAPVKLETEPASLPPAEAVAEAATPFPVLTDIVRRGEIIADLPSSAPQPEEITAPRPADETVNIPEAFIQTEPSDSYASVATPVLTDIVWRGDVFPYVSPGDTQASPQTIEEIPEPAEATDNSTSEFISPEQAPQAETPDADASVEITHLVVPTDNIPEAFTSPELAELLATSVATHVLGMIDGHLMHEVNTVVAQRLRRVVDETLSTLLTQLALDMESLVREAVVEELARHGIHPANPPENPSDPV